MAKQELAAMGKSMNEFAAKTKGPVPPVLEAARKELEGQVALFEKKTGKGLKLMETAGTMERSLRYTEPPSYPRPVLNVLGEKSSSRRQAGNGTSRVSVVSSTNSPAIREHSQDWLKPKHRVRLERGCETGLCYRGWAGRSQRGIYRP